MIGETIRRIHQSICESTNPLHFKPVMATVLEGIDAKSLDFLSKFIFRILKSSKVYEIKESTVEGDKNNPALYCSTSYYRPRSRGLSMGSIGSLDEDDADGALPLEVLLQFVDVKQITSVQHLKLYQELYGLNANESETLQSHIKSIGGYAVAGIGSATSNTGAVDKKSRSVYLPDTTESSEEASVATVEEEDDDEEEELGEEAELLDDEEYDEESSSYSDAEGGQKYKKRNNNMSYRSANKALRTTRNFKTKAPRLASVHGTTKARTEREWYLYEDAAIVALFLRRILRKDGGIVPGRYRSHFENKNSKRKRAYNDLQCKNPSEAEASLPHFSSFDRDLLAFDTNSFMYNEKFQLNANQSKHIDKAPARCKNRMLNLGKTFDSTMSLVHFCLNEMTFAMDDDLLEIVESAFSRRENGQLKNWYATLNSMPSPLILTETEQQVTNVLRYYYTKEFDEQAFAGLGAEDQQPFIHNHVLMTDMIANEILYYGHDSTFYMCDHLIEVLSGHMMSSIKILLKESQILDTDALMDHDGFEKALIHPSSSHINTNMFNANPLEALSSCHRLYHDTSKKLQQATNGAPVDTSTSNFVANFRYEYKDPKDPRNVKYFNSDRTFSSKIYQFDPSTMMPNDQDLLSNNSKAMWPPLPGGSDMGMHIPAPSKQMKDGHQGFYKDVLNACRGRLDYGPCELVQMNGRNLVSAASVTRLDVSSIDLPWIYPQVVVSHDTRTLSNSLRLLYFARILALIQSRPGINFNELHNGLYGMICW